MEEEQWKNSLFGNLEGGELTEEQWEKFQEFQIQCGNLVCHDVEPYVDGDDDEDDEDSDSGDEIAAAGAEGKDDQSDSDTCASESVTFSERDKELTNKYLNGELTFTEYSNLAENIGKDEKDGSAPEDSLQDSADKFIEEMDLQQKSRKRPKRNKLPRDLQGLLGEANLCFARNETENAIKMCMEIIRLAPKAPEPFQTLGMIYEELEDLDKSLQYSLIAAFLSPNDPEEWVKLADMSLEQQDQVQAITCYTNALKGDPNNPDIHWSRCVQYELQGKKKKALEGYQQMLKIYLKTEDHEQCFVFAREMCKTYHEMGDTKQAVVTMTSVFEKLPEAVSFQDINILVELHISLKQYKEAANIFRKYTKVVFFTLADDAQTVLEDIDENSMKNVIKCTIPDEFPVDLNAKLAVVLLYLNGTHLVDEVLVEFYKENIEEIGDLYLDLAEAYMDIGLHLKAEPLLADLVNSENYNLAAVWLRFAECLHALGKVEDAANAYNRVVELAPSHADARMCLSTLLQQLGRTDEAIDVVSSQDSEGLLNAQLLLQRCNLLYSQQNHEEFLNTAMTLLDMVMPSLSTEEEISLVLNNSSSKHRLQALRELQKENGIEPWAPSLKESDVCFNDLWKLYLKVCETLFEKKQYKNLRHFSLRALASQPLTKSAEKQKEAEFMCILACYFNKDAKCGYQFVRDLVVEVVDCKRAWNLFGHFVGLAQDMRHNRFLLRFVLKLLAQEKDSYPVLLLNGHNALVSGSYKHALGEYMGLLKSNPSDPFLYLMVGLTFTHLACQKFAANKHSLVVQAIAFLHHYQKLRGECQETLYNIGRALHQLGLTYIAAYYYKKALEAGSCITDDPDKIFDLSGEIAFNLSIIYKNSGSEDLALMYLDKYCVI